MTDIVIDLFVLLFCAGTIVFNRRWVEQVMDFWVIDKGRNADIAQGATSFGRHRGVRAQ
jgi:hypothetical protein